MDRIGREATDPDVREPLAGKSVGDCWLGFSRSSEIDWKIHALDPSSRAGHPRLEIAPEIVCADAALPADTSCRQSTSLDLSGDGSFRYAGQIGDLGKREKDRHRGLGRASFSAHVRSPRSPARVIESGMGLSVGALANSRCSSRAACRPRRRAISEREGLSRAWLAASSREQLSGIRWSDRFGKTGTRGKERAPDTPSCHHGGRAGIKT